MGIRSTSARWRSSRRCSAPSIPIRRGYETILRICVRVRGNRGASHRACEFIAYSDCGGQFLIWYEARGLEVGPSRRKAETYFERALAVARTQQAKSWELRAATSLARLWRDQGKVQ